MASNGFDVDLGASSKASGLAQAGALPQDDRGSHWPTSTALGDVSSRLGEMGGCSQGLSPSRRLLRSHWRTSAADIETSNIVPGIPVLLNYIVNLFISYLQATHQDVECSFPQGIQYPPNHLTSGHIQW